MYQITDSKKTLFESQDVLQIDTAWDFLTMQEEALREKYRHLNEQEFIDHCLKYRCQPEGELKLMQVIKVQGLR